MMVSAGLEGRGPHGKVTASSLGLAHQAAGKSINKRSSGPGAGATAGNQAPLDGHLEPNLAPKAEKALLRARASRYRAPGLARAQSSSFHPARCLVESDLLGFHHEPALGRG